MLAQFAARALSIVAIMEMCCDLVKRSPNTLSLGRGMDGGGSFNGKYMTFKNTVKKIHARIDAQLEHLSDEIEHTVGPSLEHTHTTHTHARARTHTHIHTNRVVKKPRESERFRGRTPRALFPVRACFASSAQRCRVMVIWLPFLSKWTPLPQRQIFAPQ